MPGFAQNFPEAAERPRSASPTPVRWGRTSSFARERVGSGGSGFSGAEVAAGVAARRGAEAAAARALVR